MKSCGRSIYVVLLILAAALLTGTVVLIAGGGNEESGAGACTLQMFGNRSGAYWACRVQAALQQNWFPDPIQGLFSYQTWNGMDGFWQNGVVVETSANALHYLNTTRYHSVVLGSYRGLEELLLAYGPQPSFDDMAWYGLAYTRVYEVTRRGEFLTISQAIFDWIWREGWDESTCGGGIWFDNNFNSKQTIENVQMIQLAARLARLLPKTNSSDTSNSQAYLKKAQLVLRWVEAHGLYDNATHQVFDGLDLSSCTTTDRTTYTYTAGTLLGGLVELYSVTHDAAYLVAAHNITQSVMRNLTSADGILLEPCDRDSTCDLDDEIFKGIFMKNLRYLMDADPHSLYVPSYMNFVKRNIAAVKNNTMCEPRDSADTSCHIVYLDGPPAYTAAGPVFDAVWTGPYKQSRPIQQTSVLDLFLAGVENDTRCVGPACHYDPVAPPPRPLTCKDDPCPLGQDCCEYSGRYSCCDSNQKCVDHICT